MKYTQQQAKALHLALLEASRALTDLDALAENHDAVIIDDALRALDLTPVIFRKAPGGDVIALFPAMPGQACNPHTTCGSYQHGGQHGSADIALGKRWPLASRAEFLPLKKELEGLGYRLKVITKVAAKHHRERLAALSN